MKAQRNRNSVSKPLASIIIVTFNSSNYILTCLESLRCQEGGIPTEIIVYDNHSNDETVELICDNFPGLRLIRGQSNIGFAAANNVAAKSANGEFLVFLNPDTIVTRGWLEPLLDGLQCQTEAGAVTSTLTFAQMPETINARGNTIHLSGITYCRDLGLPLSTQANIEVNAISGAAFAMRKEVFEQVQGFEEHLFLYFEDTDLSLKLRCAGYRCFLAADSVVRHNYAPNFSPRKIYYLERNRYLSLLSLLPWPAICVSLPSLVLMEIVIWLYCFMQGRSSVKSKLHAWRDIIGSRKWLWQRRHKSVCGNTKTLFVLGAFSPQLSIQYVDGKRNKLVALLETMSWAVAVFPLRVTRYLCR
jgi:GT2 family glycosyltransferase